MTHMWSSFTPRQGKSIPSPLDHAIAFATGTIIACGVMLPLAALLAVAESNLPDMDVSALHLASKAR